MADRGKRAAEKLGGESEEFTIHVKGLESPMHDPRAFASWAVAYPACNCGARDMHAPTFWLDRRINFSGLGFPEKLHCFTSEGKAE